eukprot:TRINITY_DN63788_c0_g1_i1.p1 TRINITY_DN63788_c0_g1~~TRINITY_DN63788_c0_g1_i1.p1  ORF type:complete len:405 (-),score=-26.39 TRINITY_DN63788_c0_g1_i1:164-1252(-)
MEADGSIAEWVAQSCMEDDDASTQTTSPSSSQFSSHAPCPGFVNWRNGSIAGPSSYYGSTDSLRGSPSPDRSLTSSPAISRSSTLSSRLWSHSSSAASLSPPRSGSPTSVLSRHASATSTTSDSEAWDLLFEAATKIQEMSLDDQQHLPLAATSAVSASAAPSFAAASASQQHYPRGQKFQEKRQSPPSRRRGPAPMQKASPLGRIESESEPRVDAHGTGVFLPRGASPSGSAPKQAHPQNRANGRKPQRPGATVYLPPRLVHVLGLNVDDNNNVLLNRADAAAGPSGAPCAAGPHGARRGVGNGAGRTGPVIKVASEEMLASNSSKGLKGGRSRARAAAGGGMGRVGGTAGAAVLPNEWTY